MQSFSHPLARFSSAPYSQNLQLRYFLLKSFILMSFFFQFLGSVSSPQIVGVVLKHLHQLSMFVPYFTRLRRPLLKRLVSLWGSGEETVRVVAFLCLLKITTNQQQALLEKVLKVWPLFVIRHTDMSENTVFDSQKFLLCVFVTNTPKMSGNYLYHLL
jgi:hypothetical protein